MLARTPRTAPFLAEPAAPRLTKDRRRQLRETTADILRTGKPTVFALEGATRHGLRVAFIFTGISWHRADFEAERIVALALRQLGVTRPSWEEGQREYTAAGAERCMVCGKPLPDDRNDGLNPRKFCSEHCRRARQNLRYAEQHRAELAAYARAWRAAAANRVERTCVVCGKTWNAPVARRGREPQRFCSTGCRNRFGGKRFGELKTMGRHDD